MKTISVILVSAVALLHVWFMVLESFLWTKPLGLKTFSMTPEMAEATRVLAFNQGIYNLFLAAGLFFGLYTGDFKTQCFFLICIVIAGIAGGMTASKSILFVQALPALTALTAVVMFKLQEPS